MNALPKLKFLDLTSNNIPTGSFMDSVIKLKDKLVLLNDNMFITNSQNNNIKYIKYLSEKLPTFDTEIKNLNLSGQYFYYLIFLLIMLDYLGQKLLLF